MKRKTSTPKNSITDAPASFREELRLLKERIVHLETIVDKIDELEEKIEELIKREPAVLDPNLEPSLSATGRPVEGAKDVVPLVGHKYSSSSSVSNRKSILCISVTSLALQLLVILSISC
ncbi:hypothetical protein EMCRGX_G010035 [Ephydatia muelleri]